MNNNHKVLVAMSGGVDSSVAAALLQRQGYEVSGVTLRLFDNCDVGLGQKTCCSLADVEDARSVAHTLGFDHYVFNFRERFMQDVVDRFTQQYLEGRTPNPCIDCNRYIKFSALLERALLLDHYYIATGHYARVEKDEATGRYLLKRPHDRAKDQTYALYCLTQEQLAHTLFPLGELDKPQVRSVAAELGLRTASKPDSQDICFVPDGDYAVFIEKHTGAPVPPGDFIDPEGNPIGKHQGVVRYTIGQRKGLGGFGRPVYVLAKDAATNTVTLGDSPLLYAKRLIAEDVNLISIAELTAPMRVTAKARYRQADEPATLYPLSEGRVLVEFDTPQRAITPGQAVVFYDGELVVGGGTIERAD